MSLARAFTTRRVKQSLQTGDGEVMPHRSNTTKGYGSIRNKISGPVQLVHTTNMLSYNAPDITPKSASSISSSSKSDDDLSDAAHTNTSSPPTSPDVASPPKSTSIAKPTSTVEPNHLSCYFSPPGQETMAKKADAPVIPQRAPSHTKKSYDGLTSPRSTSRLSEQSQRTVSTKASFTFSSRASSSSTSTSSSTPPPTHHVPKIPSASYPSPSPTPAPAPVSAPAPAPIYGSHKLASAQPPVQRKKELTQSTHPFGHELAQVTELAEEFGVRDKVNVLDREEREMVAKGLCKIRVEDYLAGIDELYDRFFPEVSRRVAPAASAWI